MKKKAKGLTAEHAVAAAHAELKRIVPAGWEPVNVMPPWAGHAGTCRACDGPDRSDSCFVALLTRKVPNDRIVQFTFAMVCRKCLDDPEMMSALSDRAFALQ